MSNATQRVARDFRTYRDENVSHSYGTLSSPLQLYTGAMIGIGVGGYLAKFDDTQSLKLHGLILDVENIGGSQGPKIPRGGAASGTAGDGTLDVDVKQAPAFVVKITGVAITDIGRRVYALDDQTGTLDPSATTYANLIGTVKDLVYATNAGSAVADYALVKAVYEQPTGNQLQVFAASGAVVPKTSTVLITKAGVAALTIVDPTTGTQDGVEITVLSTTAQAHTLVAPSGFNASGTTATFSSSKGNNIILVAMAGKWYVKGSIGITLS